MFVFSCANNSEKKKFANIISYEMIGRDTLNCTDENKMKQGHWIVFKMAVLNHTIYTQSANDTAKQKSITRDAERVKVEEGFYKDNKKEGVWKTFSPVGELKDSFNYKDGDVVR